MIDVQLGFPCNRPSRVKVINWMLLGDRNVASSRLRGWKIGEELRRRGYQVNFNKSDLDCDCFIVQKRGGFRHLMEQHPNSIFDFDDRPTVREITRCIRSAKKVVIGQIGLRKYCHRGALIPDCLDNDSNIKKENYRETGLLIWFGNPNNCWQIEKYLDAFSGWKLVIITDYKHHTFHFNGKAELRMWTLETVDQDIIQGDIVILPYDLHSEKTRFKGASKLLKSWSVGMPAIVSPIEECREVSRESGINCLAIGIEKWRMLLEKLRDPKLRKQWGEKGNIFSRKFEVGNVADRWEEVINMEDGYDPAFF